MPTLGQVLNGFVKTTVGILAFAALIAALIASPWWWLAVIPLFGLWNHIEEEGAFLVFTMFAIAALIAGYVSTAWWWLVAGLLLTLAVVALEIEPVADDAHDEDQGSAGTGADAPRRPSGAGALAAGLAAGYVAHEILDDDCDDGGD